MLYNSERIYGAACSYPVPVFRFLPSGDPPISAPSDASLAAQIGLAAGAAWFLARLFWAAVTP